MLHVVCLLLSRSKKGDHGTAFESGREGGAGSLRKVFSWCMQLLVLLLLHNIILSVFEITLVRLSETSDYLPGQVNNPLAVIRQASEKLQPDFICHII